MTSHVEHGHTYIDVVIKGEDRTFDLTDMPTLSIGRSPQSTVVLGDDPMVSRKHALVQREASGDYYLSDLGSRNGTFVNGDRIGEAPTALQNEDLLKIGNTLMKFQI